MVQTGQLEVGHYHHDHPHVILMFRSPNPTEDSPAVTSRVITYEMEPLNRYENLYVYD